MTPCLLFIRVYWLYSYADLQLTPDLLLLDLICACCWLGSEALWSKKVLLQTTLFPLCVSHLSSRVAWACSHLGGRFPRRSSKKIHGYTCMPLIAIRFAPFPLAKAKHKTRLNSNNEEAYSIFLVCHNTKSLDIEGVKNFCPCYLMYHKNCSLCR